MRTLLAVILLGSLLAVTTAPAGAATRCRPVAFTPNSDDLAGAIRATGVTCAYARELIRDSEGRPPRRFRRFTCTRRHFDDIDGLAYTRYRCARGDRLITWRRY